MTYSSTGVTAITRNQLRNQIITSLYGRRSGLDIADYEVGENDTRLPIDNITTTAASSLTPSGFSVLGSSAAATYTMLNAVSGVYKQITQMSSTTGGIVVQLGANANIVTSAGSSFNQMTFAGIGHTANLACVSTSTSNGPIWLNTSPASPGLTYSTY